MNKNDLVRDDEVLYRSVRGKYGEEYSYDNRADSKLVVKPFAIEKGNHL